MSIRFVDKWTVSAEYVKAETCGSQTNQLRS